MKKNNPFKIGIIGCGLIGSKRAESLGKDGSLVTCADLDFEIAKKFANKYGGTPYKDWRNLIDESNIDILIISTTHNSLSEIAIEGINKNINIFIEKPAGINSKEIQSIIDVSKNKDVKVHVGFNHRYHRAIIKAKELVDAGEIGKLMFIRGRYGHGGRVGYNNEWRANPKLSGGGELIDQGSHLIDLSRWFLGELKLVKGVANTFFWDMPVDDNAFMILNSSKKQVAFLHASCTEWKNLFSMEIYGRKGKIELNGLGGSYGVERLTFYKMLPEMGPPETFSWEYPMKDNSWLKEMEEFYDNIIFNQNPQTGLDDAYGNLKIIEEIYNDSGYIF